MKMRMYVLTEACNLTFMSDVVYSEVEKLDNTLHDDAVM